MSGGIEVLRAGDYGRGFAVVSADVRSLAKESADSADKIKDIVKRVQQQVAKFATDIEQAGNKARQEVQSAEEVSRQPDHYPGGLRGSPARRMGYHRCSPCRR